MLETIDVGIDVALASLTVVVLDAAGQPGPPFEVPNTAAGCRRLLRRLERLELPVRACLEPTSTYHLRLAFTLCASARVTVCLVNPRAVRDFARGAMGRGKTDAADALVLARYGRALEPWAWQPPGPVERELRAISRRLDDLTGRRTALKNRLHSLAAADPPAVVVADLQSELRSLATRLRRLRAAARAVIRAQPGFERRYQLLLSVTGIGAVSAIRLLAELGGLPAELGKKQWVAAAGLDPVPRESGKSLNGPRRISKQGNARLRTALNVPALVAARYCPPVRGYYQRLQARGLAKLAALCAVMRKLLQAIWGMFHTDQPFNPELVCQSPR